ncbi:uncharacterized protein zgc:162608 isoform X1 [Gadus macrocephalus]|uniref:uncharacterized protein zgc:162608 isoform X1 n=1 Tax=Gadus macrocephalus TaxID=80720 RepID=UPI0028CB4331|nr:uncharacterized protein zgc:162608 isoform X1 [Gadus macrocephalus]
MYFKGLIITMSLLTTSAFPLYPNANQREIALADPKENEAQDKTEHTRDVDGAYKSYMDSSDLYTTEEGEGRSKRPMEDGMRHKLNAESERLRVRMRQELAELTERLAPQPVRAAAAAAAGAAAAGAAAAGAAAAGAAAGALGDMRQRLAPLTQQLQSSLSTNAREMCGQLGLFLRGLEQAEARAEAGPSTYREAFHGMSRTLERGGATLTDVTGDFQSKASEAMDQQREREGGDGAVEEEEEERSGRMWREMRSRLAQEMSSTRLEAQSRLGALKAELTALLVTSQPLKTEVTASVSEFCQRAALQTQGFQARIERLFLGMEEEQEAPGAPSSPADSSQPGSLLQDDFSAKFSALIQDILHSVQ